jgi:hypothetical protein
MAYEMQFEPDQTPVGYVISPGRVAGFLMKVPRPEFVLPGQKLFSVLIHGHGFSLPIEDFPPVRGFTTVVFVASFTVSQAANKAIARIRKRWETFYPDAEGDLFVEIEETTIAHGHFRLRSILGFNFYYEDDDPESLLPVS